MVGGLQDKPSLQMVVIPQDNVKFKPKNESIYIGSFLSIILKNMILKIINSVLILFAVFMGMKQGYAMFSGKPELLEMFGKWHFSKTALMINGIILMISAVLILFPKTFLWGNFIMAAGILMIICFQLLDKNLKGVGIEIPFLLLNLVIIYLQHPLKN